MPTSVDVAPGSDLIQAALDSLGGPGTVYLAPGVHQVSATINLGHGQHLVGHGKGPTGNTGLPLGTLLQYLPPTGTPVQPWERWAVDVLGAEGWSVRDMRITGSPVGGYAERAGAIRVRNSLHGRVEGVWIEQFVLDTLTLGVSCEDLLATNRCGTGIFFTSSSFYNRVVDCDLRNCNALIRFGGGANTNRIVGGTLTGGCTSGVVVQSCSDIGVWGQSIEPNSHFAHVELIGASHCHFTGCRVESSEAAVRVPGTTWHISCDEASRNNRFAGNQLVTHPVETGIALVRNPAGVATRERVLSLPPGAWWTEAKFVRPGVFLKAKGGKPVVVTTHVPDDWDRQSDPVLVLSFGQPKDGAGEVSWTVEADGLAVGESWTPVSLGVTVTAAGTAGVLQRVELPLTGVLGPLDEVLEVVIDREEGAQDLDGRVTLRLVELRYRATETRFDATVV